MVATSPSGKAADTRGLLPIIVKGAICLVLLSALVLSCFVVVRPPSSNCQINWMDTAYSPHMGFQCLGYVLTCNKHPQDVRLHTSNLLTWINSNPVKGFFVFQVLYAVGTGTSCRQHSIALQACCLAGSGAQC